MVPEHVGFFLHLDASDHAVLGDQHAADLLQQLLWPDGKFRPLRSRRDGQRLDAIEGGGNSGFSSATSMRLFDSALATIWSRSRDTYASNDGPEGSIRLRRRD